MKEYLKNLDIAVNLGDIIYIFFILDLKWVFLFKKTLFLKINTVFFKKQFYLLKSTTYKIIILLYFVLKRKILSLIEFLGQVLFGQILQIELFFYL